MSVLEKNRRLTYLHELTADGEVHANDYVVRALLFSLTPEEAVSFFDLNFNQHYTVRHWLVEKISRDAEREVNDFHIDLAHELLDMVGQTRFPKRETCAFALGCLCKHMPGPLKNRIITELLSSPYSKLRLRGYKYLREKWMPEFVDQIAENWERFKEEKSAWLIIEHASDIQLFSDYNEYIKHFNPFQRSRLFLRLAQSNIEVVEELKAIDGISYAYVRAKLHKPLSSDDAKGLLKQNKDDARIGLLFWSLSQMELFEVIADFHMEHGSPDPERLPPFIL